LVPAEATHFKRFPLLDQMTGGLRPYEFTLLSGQTGSGKTQLMANLSHDLILSKTPHFVASVETGPVDFMVRVMSTMAGKDWNSGNAVPVGDLSTFRNRYPEIRDNYLHLSLYDNRVSVERLMHDLAWHQREHGAKIAILDNLNFFLEVTDAQNANREMDRVIHELVIFCKRVPMHLILVVHPRKNDSGRVTSGDDIRGSVLASQEAHNIVCWNRAHPDNVKNGLVKSSDRELTILKMRRRGRYVGQTLVFSHEETVRFHEAGVLSGEGGRA
jgi:twinkle protein